MEELIHLSKEARESMVFVQPGTLPPANPLLSTTATAAELFPYVTAEYAFADQTPLWKTDPFLAKWLVLYKIGNDTANLPPDLEALKGWPVPEDDLNARRDGDLVVFNDADYFPSTLRSLAWNVECFKLLDTEACYSNGYLINHSNVSAVMDSSSSTLIYTDTWTDINTLIPKRQSNISLNEWRKALEVIYTYAAMKGRYKHSGSDIAPAPIENVFQRAHRHCKACPSHGTDGSLCSARCTCCCNKDGLDQHHFVEHLVEAGAEVAKVIYNAALGDLNLMPFLGTRSYMIHAIADVYALQHCYYLQRNEEVKEALEQVVSDTSTKLLNYVTMACLGEARHCHTIKDPATVTNNTLFKAFTRLGHQPGRLETWAAVPYLDMMFGRTGLLELLVDLFLNVSWSVRSFGGRRWGVIANLGLLASSGQITPMTFIDQVANSVHNGGWAFDKWYQGTAECCNQHRYTTLKQVLDIKANNAARLPLHICLSEPASRNLPRQLPEWEREALMIGLNAFRQRKERVE